MASDFSNLAAELFPLRTATFETHRYADRIGADVSIYRPDTATPPPLAVLFHGGGWTRGHAARNVFLAVPLIRAGWAVANVSYRLAHEARAPAAADDAAAAVAYCFSMAPVWGIDTRRIVPFGISAGGHLALYASLAPDPSTTCSSRPRVAAVVDLYGVADPLALLNGEDAQPFARAWFGTGPQAAVRALGVSPLALAENAGSLPSLFIAHGRDDRIVPVGQSITLRDSWAKGGGDVDLLLVNGGHGHFALQERQAIFAGVETFLTVRGIWPA